MRIKSHNLFSTNTLLAYRISERYYDNKHYVWCTPHFDGDDMPGRSISLPSSSCPKNIAQRINEEIMSRDLHGAKIEKNRGGIKRGAQIMLDKGLITEATFKDIIEIVAGATLVDFQPLLYVIPFEKVSAQLLEAAIGEKAHPLSEEFIIEDLERKHFDIISLSL